MLNLMKPSGKVTKNGLKSKPPVILMNVCWRFDMKYVAMFVGLIALASIPDNASWLQFAVQSIFGLVVFAAGTIFLLQTEK